MESRISVQSLAKSIHSLLGLKRHLTSSWADSVCNIIKDLPSEESSNGSQIKCLTFNAKGFNENKDVDVDDDVLKIQDDLTSLNTHLNQLNLQRRQALNDFLDLKGNIRVFCRIRPVIVGEKFGHLGPVVASDSCNVVLKLSEKKKKHYHFDKVFHQGSSQDEVFSEVEPVIKSVMDGYNVCIIAYGQTGTGKTFTMEGRPDCPGIVPRTIEALFKQAVDSSHSFFFTFSMLEIYMGNLRDLLIPQMTKPTDPIIKGLSIQTDPMGGIEIDNLVAVRVSDFNQAIRLYKLGSRFRSTASTNSNLTSSRSHCLIRMSLTCFDAPERQRETNKIWMVDLGGSERVLKTKAWGRRFEEGKAINLSLSALGDVISALQRRKPHVPYRNSKLTQVLRDSLGEDSKTLMLVHVSPKEEDLCETICSLGFATRVKSVHLGNGESTEVQAKKEIAKTKLLQKVKELESEGQGVRREIKKLNERLEHLTGVVPSYGKHLEALHLSNEVSQSNTEMEKHSIEDVTATSSSKLPRFMRPTICSRRKSGTDHQTPENSRKRIPLPGRRRKSSSVCTATPRLGFSEYGSECSTSRTSCLLSLKMKNSTDYETEYSHDASECDIKTVVFPEQEKSLRSLGHPAAHLTHRNTDEYGNRKANKIDSLKFLAVDKWLHLQKSEPRTSTYTHQNKRVYSIPVSEKTRRCDVQYKEEELQHEKVHNHNVTKKKILKNDNIKKLSDIEAIGQPIAEALVDKTEKFLDDFVIEDSGCNSISLSHTTDNKVMEETWGLSNGYTIKNDGCNTFSPPDMQYNRFKQNKDYSRVTGTSTKMVVTSEIHNLSEGFTFKYSTCNLFSSSEMENNLINLNEESHDPVTKSELESEIQRWPTDTSIEAIVGHKVMIDQKIQTEVLSPNGNISKEDSTKEDLCASPQYIEGLTRSCLDTMRSQRALFRDLNDDCQKDPTKPLTEAQLAIHNTGICKLLGQKVQTLCASVLLGLGVQNLGLGNDFFYGLML